MFGSDARALISSTEVIAPAKVISEFAKGAEALEIKGGVVDGAITSSFENATADGPTKSFLRSSRPAFSAARLKIEFLITLNSTPDSGNGILYKV